jgi:uncharacterized protein (TIGR03083 family)
MQLSPLYDGPPILAIDGLGDPSAPLIRQRQRLLAVLRTLTDEQWATTSRCERWSVKDVVSHLAGTDRFWTIMFAAAMRGEPTRFLATFDPVATPEQMVDAMRALSADEVLVQHEANVAALIDTLAAVTDWSVVGEAPPGHVPLNVTALHALWDAWIHERDILLPLGLTPVEEPDELEAILPYAAALSPALYAAHGNGRRGELTIEATDPAIALRIEVGDQVVVHAGAGTGPRITGRAVDIIEGLSHRAQLAHDLGPDDEWLLLGLAEVFDLA